VTEQERVANRAATFLRMEADETLPCLVVGGVQVYAYLKDGELRVSVDTEGAEIAVDTVRIALNDYEVAAI
jgi:hypothetical protein